MSLKNTINSLLMRGRRSAVPRDPRGSDLYLVEFPKSGVTWISTILANCFLLNSGVSQRATFYNVSQYVADIHMTGKDVGPPLWVNPGFRLIKSHAEYCSRYLHTIYIARHPVSVMRSYRTFLSEHGVAFRSTNEFLTSKRYGVPAWRRHVRSWIENRNQASRLYLVRYEDLIGDAEAEILTLSDVLGFGVSKEVVCEAVRLSCADEMARSHAAYSSRNPRYRLDFVKGHRKEFSQGDVEWIENQCVEELNMLGYA